MGGPQKLGIIDTLSAGFSIINRRLWLIAVPLVLDLLLWLGPKVQTASLVDQTLNSYHQLQVQYQSSFATQQDSDKIEKVFTEITSLVKPVGALNVLSVLGWQMHGLSGTAGTENGTTLDIGSFKLLLAVLFGLGALSVLAVCVYLGAIAECLREATFDWGRFLGRLSRYWVRVISYFLFVFAAMLSVGLVSLILIGITGLFLPGLAAVIGLAALTLGLWLMIYLFFAKEAIFLSDAGALNAMRYSINVVQHNFFPAIGLFFLTNIILLGVPIALQLLFWHPIGVVGAMAVNAYIASGLAAATMIFYQQRWNALQESTVRMMPNGTR